LKNKTKEWGCEINSETVGIEYWLLLDIDFPLHKKLTGEFYLPYVQMSPGTPVLKHETFHNSI